MNQMNNICQELYQNQGKDPKLWRKLLQLLLTGSEHNEFFIFIKKIIETEPRNELPLDLLDYIIDNNISSVTNLVSSKNFLDSLIRLLRTEIGASVDVQKKVLYLIQKWAVKYQPDQNNISPFGSFNETYQFLKSQGIFFPPVGDDSVVTTYATIFANEDKDPFPSQIAQGFPSQNPQAFPPQNPQAFPSQPLPNKPIQPQQPTFDNIQNNFAYPSLGGEKEEVVDPYETNNNGFQAINEYDINAVDNNYPINKYNNNNKNNFYNNNNGNFSNNNGPELYLTQGEYNKVKNIVNIWMCKLNHINFMIDQGQFSSYDQQLRSQIIELKNTKQQIDSYILQYNQYKEALHMFVNLQKDINLTLFRYDQLLSGNPVDRFQSSFANTAMGSNFYTYYDFSKSRPEDRKFIDTEKLKDGLSNVGHKVGNGLSKAGEKMGEGLSYVGSGLKKGGKKIKGAFVGAFEKLKDKWNEI